jgi:hypothetical protein
MAYMNQMDDIIAATKQKLQMPQDAKPKYDNSYPLAPQMGMVAPSELPNQSEPKPKPHSIVKPIKVY